MSKKKITHPERSMEELIARAVDAAKAPFTPSRKAELPSLRSVAEELGTTVIRTRKLLITAGYFESPLSRSVQKLKAEGKTIEEIGATLRLKPAAVYGYLPYELRPYNLPETTSNADRHNRYRATKKLKAAVDAGKDVAFVIRKGALTDAPKVEYKNDNHMIREEIIQHIVKASGEDPIVSTTGKASRELFETRVANGQSHKYDFLTVGSMGHSSSIALGVAINKPEQRIWCVDGDGAVLMHMGSMAVLGSNKPKNLIHVVINNGAHETVGGMPTVATDIDLVGVAKACGYPYAVSVESFEKLDAELEAAKERGELSLIEVKCSIGAREDLGRPTTTALENKQNFMEYLKTL